MELRIGQLAPDVYVAGQIQPGQVAAIAGHGIRTIVNNRPDGEEPGQPAAADIEAAAEAAGVHYVNLPVRSNGVTPQDVAAFRELRDSLESPVLLFCRSGARCAMLWQMANQSR